MVVLRPVHHRSQHGNLPSHISTPQFSHQDLSDITFTACTFIRCDFRRANLRDATFINCKFIEQGDIEGCHFDVADLRDASFQQCQLAMANFSNANCYGIELRECDLKGPTFPEQTLPIK